MAAGSDFGACFLLTFSQAANPRNGLSEGANAPEPQPVVLCVRHVFSLQVLYAFGSEVVFNFPKSFKTFKKNGIVNMSSGRVRRSPLRCQERVFDFEDLPSM